MLSKKVERFKAGVYKITNLVNGKIYVGSSVNIYNRKHTHSTKLSKNVHHSRHLQNSYNKYGKDSFLFEVLEYCDKLNITKREQYYIDVLKPEYNKRKQAQNNIGLKRSKEVVEKISKILKEKYKKGEISAYRQQHKWRKVEQYDLEGNFLEYYNNSKEAEIKYDLTLGNISRATKEGYITHIGYQWKYSDSKKSIINIKKFGHPTRGSSVIITNIKTRESETFYSIQKLCEVYKFPVRSIEKVLSRDNKIYKKMYKITYNESIKNRTSEANNKKMDR